MLLHTPLTTALLFTTIHASPLQGDLLQPRAVAFRQPPQLQCFTTNSINFAPFADCSEAVKNLPETSANSTFHNGPPYNDYNLDYADRVPKAFNGVCTIHVSLISSARADDTSWKEVKDSAQTIVDQCHRSRDGNEVTGGYAYLGTKGGVLVSVRLEQSKGPVPVVAIIPSESEGGSPYPPDEPFTNIG